MFGLEPVINMVLIALLTRGHVLLEGNPGLGKTDLVKTLSDALGLGSEPLGPAVTKPWGRIQFTPDLMPSDITGTLLPDRELAHRLVFKHGPLFSNLLLADEINRATPKTQSAMLEAMAENQVTVLGETHPLTARLAVRGAVGDALSEIEATTPFFVIATQNPIEQEGTNPLPEAQLDRFLFKIRMPFPERAILQKIVEKIAGPGRGGGVPQSRPSQADSMLFHLSRLAGALRCLQPADPVRAHILNMVMASVGRFDQVQDVTGPRLKMLQDFCRQEVEMPLGPRAAGALTLGVLGWSMLALVSPAEPEQIPARTAEALGTIVVPALRHRMRFGSAYAGPGGVGDEGAPDDKHDAMVRAFATHAAPAVGDYARTFADMVTGAAHWTSL
ncbi:MAG: AAA family ATPase [Rhodobacteraceae bacterium]|nr:AAA family ATPase [Paracoccaceae bacterium]